MNNDLISRDALIEDLFLKFGNQLPNGLLEEIDKAPTVELFCSYLSDEEVRQPCVEAPCEQESELIKAYTKGFNTGVEIVKNARLQGEWLFVSRNCWKCPYCQELTNEGKNFCPNCGAKMRKGGAK